MRCGFDSPAPCEWSSERASAPFSTEGLAGGHVVVFGPVGDPRGAYGIGIAEFPDEPGVRAFRE
jgi:hypothetical protein